MTANIKGDKKKRFAKTCVSVAMSAIIIVGGAFSQGGRTAYASGFSDVPANHWASSSIAKIAELGIMVGDSSGKYYPNQTVDKFYATKAMAKVAGYKTAGVSDAEKAFQDSAYEAHKGTLGIFKSSFTKWDSSADREIAFLLEKQVYTVDDLNKFITKQPNGAEAVRSLTKEDAAMFLVRVMGKQQEALSQNPAEWSQFSDDSQISATVRPFVYYMKKSGILAGDTANKFNPKQEVSKAVLATLLNNVMTTLSPQATPNTQQGNTIESISGFVVDVYAQKGALQIETAQGVRSIHNIASGALVTVDGVAGTIANIRTGMSFTSVLVNDEFTNFKAQTVQAGQGGTSVQSGQNTNTAQIPENASAIEGTVSAVSDGLTERTVSVDVRMLNAVGTIYNETRVLTLAGGCNITRGGTSSSFGEIKAGDIVSAKVLGNTAYAIDAKQAQMNFSGVLQDKKTNELTATNSYVIEDANGVIHEFIVDDKTVIERAVNETGLKWGDLRLGDKVTVKTSYNVITYIRGEGYRTNVEGVVSEIHILEGETAKILFKNSVTNEAAEYSFASNIVDVYSMRIGDKLRLRLDSREIDSYTKLENSFTQNVTGKITSVRNRAIVVTPAGQTAGVVINYDENTYVYDAVQRKSSSTSAILQSMEVFVTYQQGSSNYASSITILTR